MTSEDELIEREITFCRFRKLITELRQGGFRRTEFRPWEMEILVDLDTCGLERRHWDKVLLQYLKAVQKQLDAGPGPPMKISEFLQPRRTRRPSTE